MCLTYEDESNDSSFNRCKKCFDKAVTETDLYVDNMCDDITIIPYCDET